jgi:hypothetical protein
MQSFGDILDREKTYSLQSPPSDQVYAWFSELTKDPLLEMGRYGQKACMKCQ